MDLEWKEKKEREKATTNIFSFPRIGSPVFSDLGHQRLFRRLHKEKPSCLRIPLYEGKRAGEFAEIVQHGSVVAIRARKRQGVLFSIRSQVESWAWLEHYLSGNSQNSTFCGGFTTG